MTSTCTRHKAPDAPVRVLGKPRCRECSHSPQDFPPLHRRPLIRVVDDTGATYLCGLCVLPLLSQPGTSLVLARSAMQATA